MRRWFIVRVREKIGPNKFVKKSKFYFARNSGEAAKKYRGGGHVMYVEKATREKMLNIGEFFTLGDALLREFARMGKGGDSLEQIIGNPGKEKRRGYYAKQRKETAHHNR